MSRIHSFSDSFSEGIQALKNKIGGVFTKLSTTAETKANLLVLKNLGYTVITGGEKEVIIPPKPITRSGINEPEKVYYIPLQKFFRSKESALKRERAKMEDIKKSAGKNGAHLAVESKEVEGKQKIAGQYTLEVDKAKGDFESEIRNKNKTTMQDRIRLGGDYLRGLSALHQANYAYGDIKPENSLVYVVNGETRLKISDFGKAEKLKEGESKTYKGNLRFAPPEGTLSKKGDVYGAALVLIRTLEEQYLNETGEPLVPVKTESQESVKALEKRRGVEQYIVDHKAFPGMDEPSLSDKIFRRIPRQAMLTNMSDTQKNEQHQLLEAYIDVLRKKLEADPIFGGTRAFQIYMLLMDMIDTNPENRPTMEEASNKYNAIFA